VILAGGRGTRLRPYTDRLPKALLPLDGTPILEVLIRQLVAAGCPRISLALSWMAAEIQAHLGDGSRLDAEISYSVSEQLLGTAGPLALLEPPPGLCLVINADVLTSLDFRALLDAHREQHLATIVTREHEVGVRYGVVETDANGVAVEIVEKPVSRLRISTGVYVLSPDAWRYLAPGSQIEMPDLLRRLAAAGPLVGSYEMPLKAAWTDIGLPADYLEAQEAFRRDRALYLREEVALNG
jgi:NDP-sugar pyrophosphorylase family protein